MHLKVALTRAERSFSSCKCFPSINWANKQKKRDIIKTGVLNYASSFIITLLHFHWVIWFSQRRRRLRFIPSFPNFKFKKPGPVASSKTNGMGEIPGNSCYILNCPSPVLDQGQTHGGFVRCWWRRQRGVRGIQKLQIRGVLCLLIQIPKFLRDETKSKDYWSMVSPSQDL